MRAAHQGKLALQAMTAAALSAKVDGVTIAEARKIVSAIHRERDLSSGIAGVRKGALAAALSAGEVPSLSLIDTKASSLDPFKKLLFETADGHRIEAVRIPLERPGRFTACVSSQVGCALACAFCATGRLGLKRNLEAWEIVEQTRAIRRTLALTAGERLHGVVFQGMGEPLSNLDRVLEAIAVMSEPSALSIDARNITVCTAGVPSGIERLAREAPKVRLALSISSARPDTRVRLMPIERANPLTEVLEACIYHARQTGLRPLWAVTPLEGVNDSEEDARALGAMLAAFEKATGMRPRVTLVPYNQIGDGDVFRRQGDAEAQRFRDALVASGVFAHQRYSGGSDMGAACGQLAGR